MVTRLLMVFPAYAGMSLVRPREQHGSDRFPRLRGDEPRKESAKEGKGKVFPAYAGMSQPGTRANQGLTRFPRLRGDEPTERKWVSWKTLFSPPTRG